VRRVRYIVSYASIVSVMRK